MNKNALKINRWKDTQEKLSAFIKGDNVVTGDEIRKWIADCIVHFTELKMENYIVQYFLSKLDFLENQIEIKNPFSVVMAYPDARKIDKTYETVYTIGPFTHTGKGYSIEKENRLTGKTGGKSRLTPILVAFRVAENIIENHEDEERIVSKVLLNQLQDKTDQGIYLSFKKIQDAYNERDVESMLSSLISCTDLVSKLVVEVADKDLGPRMRKIYEVSEIYSKYKINREIIWGLNNARIIRNLNTHNPKEENYTTVFEAVSYCHLLVLFTTSLLASGEVNIDQF